MRLWACVLLLALSGCARKAEISRVAWPVMGTQAAVQWKGPQIDEDVIRAQRVLSEIERLLNAHDRESELSKLASLPDAEILARCDPRVRMCYEAAFRLRDETGGLFNPRWRGPGTMDLGAIAKGFAIDRCELANALVDLGGNLKAFGGCWRVGIAGGETFELKPGESCATSGEYYRGHHIRDGRTGGELTNAVYSVTVVHPESAMLADGLSTVMFLMGRTRGTKFLREHYPEARAHWIEGVERSCWTLRE